MTFAKGDRVMISDECWAKCSNDSRRVGRRGGLVMARREYNYGVVVDVLWDGVKTPSSQFIEDLAPDDPLKHTLPPAVLRRKMKVQKKFKGWQAMQTAPKDGTVIILYGCDNDLGVMVAMAWWDSEVRGGDWIWAYDGYEPTYWQPMMALPK